MNKRVIGKKRQTDRRLPQPRRVLLADQVAKTIAQEIAMQRWRGWLPSERRLQQALNVSRQTIRAALGRLVASRRLSVHRCRGYRISPNAATAGARRTQTHEIGLLCSEPIYRMPTRFILLLDLLRALCAKSGYNLEIMVGQRFMNTDPGRLLPGIVDGRPKACWILVLANRRLQEWFECSGLPVVVYGNVYAGLSITSIGMHYRACIRHATSFLLGKGHRRIGFVAYDLRRAGEQDSLAGFHEAFAAHVGDNAVPVVIERPDGDADALCRQIDRVLQTKPPPTAFVVSHTHHYASVATHLAARGLRVPQDVSLICRSEDPFLNFLRPRPAFYRSNMEVAARQLFNRVRQAIEGAGRPGDQRLLMPELVTGQSVGPPPVR